jgi:hypothetical protein
MADVYWMGGSPCAGKTTISHIIAQEFGWQIYHIDGHIETYLERATPKLHPHLSAYRKTGLKDFLLQDPQEQVSQVIGMSHEQFQFILNDIAELSGEAPILVEGANLLASDLVKQIQSSKQAIWMVPTEVFQLAAYPKRGSWVQDVLRHHYQPEEALLAFERWMERDALMAKWTATEAGKHDIRVIVVDGSVTLLDNAEIVMHHFGLLSDEH